MVATAVGRELQSWRRVRDRGAYRGTHMEKEHSWNRLGKQEGLNFVSYCNQQG